MTMNGNILKKSLIYALMVSIIVVQKWVLAIIPNFQFTTLLIVLFFYLFGFKGTLLITILYVLIDNLYMGTFHIIYTPIMLIAWCSLIFILMLFRKNDNVWLLCLIGGIHGIIYSLCYAVGGIIFYEVDFVLYLLSDIPFTLLLVVSNVITILWLYKPISKIMKKFLCENVC